MSIVSSSWGVLSARALSALGRERDALRRIEAVLAGAPRHRRALFEKAALSLRIGEPQAAELALRELVALAPNFPRALGTLAKVAFPGPDYQQVLAFLHERLAPRNYLEIGVQFGMTLRLSERCERAVGVDPKPQPKHSLGANTRVFAQTSDDFFAQHRREDVLGDRGIDLAFIDGMHRFEYVLRDFCNVEAWCHPGSTVVLHDCLPLEPESARRERSTKFWVGDSWKALECLLEERKDLSVHVIPCHPSGLVLIRNLDPGSASLRERLPELERRYLDAPYPYTAGRWPEHYPMVENSLEAIGALLPQA